MDISTEEDDDSVMNLSSTRSASKKQSSFTSQPSSVGSFDLAVVYLDVGRSGDMNAEFAMDSDLSLNSPMDYNVTLPSPPHSPPQPRQMSSRSPFETQQPSDDPDGASAWRSAANGEHGSGEMADVVNVVSSGLVKDVLAVDLIPGPIIGKGSEGHVLKMSYHTTPVAVKIMNNKTLRTRERFKNETKLLSKLSDHENIVKFVGQCRDLKAGDESAAADLVMVMEFCELGNLYKIISEAKWIRQLQAIGRNLSQFKHVLGYMLYSDWRRRLQVACDIAAGMSHMHVHEIVHRDLTSFNVVLKKGANDSWIAKICDFERSRHIPQNETIPRSDLLANSPAWSAPEVLREDPYSVQADVFSFGVILWELWTLEEPWKHPEQEIKNPMMIIPTVSNGARLDIPSITPGGLPHLPQLKALIEACWSEIPSERPTMHRAHQILSQMIHDMSE